MRCALECLIEAKIRLPQDIDVEWFGERRLVIKRDKDGFASTIRIEGKVAEDDKISMLVYQLPNGLTHFDGKGGEKIREELIADLQLIESTLRLYFRLSRVRWEYATSIVIPENPEEEQEIKWNNIKVMRNVPDDEKTVSVEDLSVILHLGHMARDLSITMSFFREGNMDMKTFRYITALFSFYFVIEGLYANGQFRSRQQRQEFSKSITLRKAIEETLKMPLYDKPAPFKSVLTIDECLKLVGKTRDVEGIIYMIVWVRGDLHHFVNNPNKLTGSPLTHQRYEILATFMHDIALNVLHDEIMARHPDNPINRKSAHHI